MRKLLMVVALSGLVGSLTCFGQSSEQLKKDRLSIEKEINTITKLITQARSVKEKSFHELELLSQQVKLRDQLVKSMQKEITQLGADIINTGLLIKSFEDEIEKAKEDLAKVAYASYVASQSQSKTLSIFSAKSITQAWARVKYFQQLSNYMKREMESIRETQDLLAQKKQYLLLAKAEKELVITKEKESSAQLVAAKEEQKKLFQELKLKEETYRKQLDEKKKDLIALNKEIDKVIKIELEKLRAEQAAAAKAKAGSGTPAASSSTTKPKAESDILLPLSKSFIDNKGKLPWPIPTPNGVITTHFGRTMLESGIEMNVNGIDITTTPDQQVRSVFEGKVLDIKELPLRGYMVVVGHGSIFTVYVNLQSVVVAKGDDVKGLDLIGTAKTNKNTGETKVHFQIFNEMTPVDPELWLVKKN